MGRASRLYFGKSGITSVGAVAAQPGPEIIFEAPGADFRIPGDLQRLPLRIVRDAGELQRGETPALVVDPFDQPGSAADLDKVSDFGSLVLQCASAIRGGGSIMPEPGFSRSKSSRAFTRHKELRGFAVTQVGCLPARCYRLALGSDKPPRVHSSLSASVVARLFQCRQREVFWRTKPAQCCPRWCPNLLETSRGLGLADMTL